MFTERREISICLTEDEKAAFLKALDILETFSNITENEDYETLENQMEKWCGRENLLNATRDGLSYILRYANIV